MVEFRKSRERIGVIRQVVIAIVTAVVCFLAPVLAGAQGWAALSPSLGQGGAVCSEGGASYPCFAFRCDAQRGLEFAFLFSGSPPSSTVAVAHVDDRDPRVMHFRSVGQAGELVANFDLVSHAELLTWMAKGASLRFQSTQDHAFTLSGAGHWIGQTLGQCAGRSDTPADLDALMAAYERLRPPAGTRVHYIFNTDFWGMDLDSGLTNPALAGLNRDGCLNMCKARPDCVLATLNEQKKVCFLKSGFGALKHNPIATSMYLQSRRDRPARTGGTAPAMTALTGLGWRAGDTRETFVSRLRQASAPLGAACGEEQRALQDWSGSISLRSPEEAGTVGQPMRFAWSADQMAVPIPAWLVVSSRTPVRFEGEGFVALNPGAIGPFGVETDRALTRVFIPLYGAGTSGELQMTPLVAGANDFNVTLVAYLRGCQQDLPMRALRWTADIRPDAPQIVLRNIADPDPYPDVIMSPAFDRIVKFDSNRFQIVSNDGTEIATRDGRNLNLSPTGRFLVSADADRFVVHDIVDGAELLRINGQSLVWWNQDSFALTDAGPWAKLGLFSPLASRVFFEDVRTGPSCCDNSGETPVSADLENGLLFAAGVRDLLSGQVFASRADMEGAEAENQRAQLLNGFLAGHRFVAPVDVGDGWKMRGGAVYSHGRRPGEPLGEVPADTGVIAAPPTRNPEFGVASSVRLASSTDTSVHRGSMLLDPQTEDATGFEAALDRWGIDLASDTGRERLIDVDIGYPEQRLEGGDAEALDSLRQEIRAAIGTDLSRANKSAAWARDPETGAVSYCDHYGANPTETGQLPDDIDLAYRVPVGNGLVWVIRTSCRGGATGGTLVSASTLTIYDSRRAGATLAGYNVDQWMTLGSSTERAFFEIGFDIKLFGDRYLVSFAPGQGALAVYDLEQRAYLFQHRTARRGGLLADVFMTSDFAHLIQMNDGGSFTIYATGTGAPILEGRYLDDELVVWNPFFQLDATEEGAGFVELRFPGLEGQYSLQQFFAARHVPGLMRRTLSGEYPPPQTPITVPPRLTGEIAALGGEVAVNVRLAEPGSAQEYLLFQDGALTLRRDTDQGGQLRVARLPGSRWATVLARSADGSVSLPLTADLGEDAGRLPRTHFLGVGVDRYDSPSLDALRFAKSDAERLSGALAGLNGKTVDLRTNRTLADDEASPSAVRDALKEILAQATPGDHVVLFFAGHGLRDAAGDFFFGTTQTDMSDIPGTALAWSDLSRLLAQKSIRATVFLDACHSASAGLTRFATNDGAVEGLRNALPDGLTVVSAAKGRQYSLEDAAVGGGYFTAALVSVLTDERAAADLNRNGVLETVELYRAVKTKVVSALGSAQTPFISRNQAVGETALF